MIKRPELLKKNNKYKDKDIIEVITGIRRCRKSTLFEIFKKTFERGLSVHTIESYTQALKRKLASFEMILDYNAKYLLTLDDDQMTTHNGIKQINALD